MKQFMLAGVSSGVGKTTVTLAILSALKNRGLLVQPYKVGPDYIDTSYHSRIVGRSSRNLDNFMIPDSNILVWSYQRWLRDVDVALVEGVMGLFDGLGADKDCASSSSIAKQLDLPVILIIDGKSTSTSAAAMVYGFSTFDSDLRIVGVIVNRVASESHYQLIKGAIERYTDLPVFGYLPKDMKVELPSRHLGLIPDVELEHLDAMFQRLGRSAEATIDLNRLLDSCEKKECFRESPFSLRNSEPLTIAYAMDEAFHFYYEDNLDFLRSQNVELIPFSPLTDAVLPQADAYYFGGGFPEIYAEKLEGNSRFRASVLESSELGKPIYAECGGLMYLGEQLEAQGKIYDMVGIFKGKSVMTSRLKRFGYCIAQTRVPSLFGPAGTEIRGHEFHHSIFETSESSVLNLQKERDGEIVSRWTGGYQKNRTFASYLHVHFYQSQQLLSNWLQYIKEAK